MNANFSPRSPLVRLIVDRNPFYLFSAVSMFTGCYILSHALAPKPNEWHKLLLLLGTVNVYEFLLIGLAIPLVTRRGLKRDAKFLLLIQALFLIDGPLLANELAGVDGRSGTILVLLLLALGAMKVWIVVKALAFPSAEAIFMRFVVQAAAMFAAPAALASIARHHSGELPLGAVYAAWWVAGAVLLVHLIPVRRPVAMFSPVGDEMRRVVGPAYTVMPYLSLLGHVWLAHWVYDVRFCAANVTPVLLALAVLAMRLPISLRERAKLASVAGGFAIALSMRFPAALLFSPTGMDGLVISPWRLALVGTAMLYGHLFVRTAQPSFIVAAAGCLVTAGLGPTFGAVVTTASMLWARGVALMRSLIPDSAVKWGVTAVVASFGFLGMGALISFRKPGESEGEGRGEVVG